MWERLTAPEDDYTKLQKDNMNIIESYGASLMEVVCRDACDGHEIGQVSMSKCMPKGQGVGFDHCNIIFLLFHFNAFLPPQATNVFR